MFNQKEYLKQWRKDNPEKHREQNERYYIKHKKELKEYHGKYYQENKEHLDRYAEQWQKDNLEKSNEIGKRWKINHPEKARKKEARHRNKRRRNLGFNPLNKPFENSEAHHINRTDIVYIPQELHRGISHCLETDKNMQKINKLAISFI